MDSTVIVALPAADDKVNRISSEKGAHLTICYLGETSKLENLEEIVLFVRHAASQLSPFGLEVDYRDILGEDEADVLFFKKDSWSFPRINDFRAHLLKNDSIARAYASAPQYPEWTPHLTLGYPEKPAHEDESDYPGIHYVQFDRIAVWTGDSEGPEFRLKYESDGMVAGSIGHVGTSDLGALAASAIFADDISLEHFGVKGMKWGTRKGDYEGASRSTNREASKDAKEFARAKLFYGKGAGTRRKLIKAKVEAKAKKDPTYQKAFDHHLAKQDLGKHASKARSERRRKDVTSGTAKTARGVHRELSGGFGSTSLASKLLAEGIKAVSHSDISTEERGEQAVAELFHYGVKGMKWGVRTVDRASQPTLLREKKALRGAKDVTVTQRKAGTYVKSKGGQRQKASADAIKAQAGRQKAKKSTTDALTNDELRATIDRMRLEQEFAKLDKKVSRQGKSFIRALFVGPDAGKPAGDLLKDLAGSKSK